MAPLRYVDWFIYQRIHESLNYVPPGEFQAHYYETNESEMLVVLEMIKSPRKPARFISFCERVSDLISLIICEARDLRQFLVFGSKGLSASGWGYVNRPDEDPSGRFTP